MTPAMCAEHVPLKRNYDPTQSTAPDKTSQPENSDQCVPPDTTHTELHTTQLPISNNEPLYSNVKVPTNPDDEHTHLNVQVPTNPDNEHTHLNVNMLIDDN